MLVHSHINLICVASFSKPEAAAAETSFVHQLFGGVRQTHFKCKSCNQLTSSHTAFLDLVLPVDKGA